MRDGKRVYGERVQYPNRVPCGVEYAIHEDGSVFSVIPAVKGRKKVKILTEVDGFEAPMSWYQRISNVVDDGSESESDSDAEFIEV